MMDVQVALFLLLENDNYMDDIKLIKSDNSYKFKTKNGNIVSKLNYHDYKIRDFDWVLLSDIETNPKYRGIGLASRLINEIYTDTVKACPTRGVYLFVRYNNHNAIKLYKKLGFITIKPYELKDGKYLIMAKGHADIKQFDKMNFR